MNDFKVYSTLGVSPASTDDEVKQAHRTASRRWHPDREGGDAEIFDQVQKAYAAIRTSRDRMILSVRLRSVGDVCGRCSGKGFRAKGKGWIKTGSAPCPDCGGCGFKERAE